MNMDIPVTPMNYFDVSNTVLVALSLFMLSSKKAFLNLPCGTSFTGVYFCESAIFFVLQKLTWFSYSAEVITATSAKSRSNTSYKPSSKAVL